MMMHPSFAELNEYADRELPESRRARVSTHLAKCSACRRTIMSLRGIAKEAPGILNVGPPAGALERILDRHAKGESVILPVADPPRRAFVPAAMWRAAAVLALLAVSAATVFMVGELGAEFSELNLRVANSTSRTVEIEYRSTSMFADEDLLVVRARYRVPGDELSGAQNRKVVSATLYRHDGGLFRGILELPDSAVFATFAVEDVAGELVDSRGGELGEFLVENAGIPLFDALVQKQQEWMERNGALALSTARFATTLYPDNPEAWARVHFIELIGVAEANRGVLEARHAARFTRFERDYAGKSLTSQQLAGTYNYALGLGDADRLIHWRNRLLTEAPSHPTAVQAQVFVITESHRDRPDLALEQLEELWQAYGSVHPELPRNGFRQALKTGAPGDIQRWADRRQAIEPWASVNIAMDLLQIPALKTNAMMRLRGQLAQWDADDRQNRALQSTAREDRLRLAALRRRALTVLGEVLVQMGQPVAALDTLGLAIVEGWDASAFRAMANAHLALGDTTNAITMMARVAADPNTRQTEVDSIEVVGRSALGQAAWEMLREGALTEMLRSTLDESVNRRVAENVELTGATGGRYRLDDLVRGHVTLVAYLTRFCRDCSEKVEPLKGIAARLRAAAGDSVEVFVILAEPPAAETRQFVAQHGITLPVFHDESRVVYAALGFWDIPGYTLLDSSSRARYVSTDLADVPRQVAALLSRDRQP